MNIGSREQLDVFNLIMKYMNIFSTLFLQTEFTFLSCLISSRGELWLEFLRGVRLTGSIKELGRPANPSELYIQPGLDVQAQTSNSTLNFT